MFAAYLPMRRKLQSYDIWHSVLSGRSLTEPAPPVASSMSSLEREGIGERGRRRWRRNWRSTTQRLRQKLTLCRPNRSIGVGTGYAAGVFLPRNPALKPASYAGLPVKP